MIEKIRTEHPELLRAPEIPQWPQGLPVALKTPSEATCSAGGVDLGDGSWLPKSRASAVLGRLVLLDNYPAMAQARIDDLINSKLPIAIDAASEIARTEASVACESYIYRVSNDCASKVPIWQVVLWITVATVAAGGVGVGVGYLLRGSQ